MLTVLDEFTTESVVYEVHILGVFKSYYYVIRFEVVVHIAYPMESFELVEQLQGYMINCVMVKLFSRGLL